MLTRKQPQDPSQTFNANIAVIQPTFLYRTDELVVIYVMYGNA